jgi:hypothetical protein
MSVFDVDWPTEPTSQMLLSGANIIDVLKERVADPNEWYRLPSEAIASLVWGCMVMQMDLERRGINPPTEH